MDVSHVAVSVYRLSVIVVCFDRKPDSFWQDRSLSDSLIASHSGTLTKVNGGFTCIVCEPMLLYCDSTSI